MNSRLVFDSIFVNSCTYYISAHADNAHTAMVNIIENVSIKKKLLGPVFDLPENKHSYRELVKSLEGLKYLQGPAYLPDSPQVSLTDTEGAFRISIA